MFGILTVLVAGGVHLTWMAASSAGPVDTLTDLAAGEAVRVETIGGQRLKGDVGDVTPVELTIVEDGRSVAVPSADVRTVRKQDSLLNGVLLGIGAGMAGTAVVSGNFCPEEGACGLIVMSASMSAGVALGAVVDAFMHRTLYHRPGDPQVRVTPLVSPKHVGARVSVHW